MFIADGRGGLGRLFFDATNPDSAHHHPNVVERFLFGSREQIGYTTQPPIPMHSHVGRFILGKRPPQEALRLCPKRFLISRRGLTNFLAATRASDGDVGVLPAEHSALTHTICQMSTRGGRGRRGGW